MKISKILVVIGSFGLGLGLGYLLGANDDVCDDCDGCCCCDDEYEEDDDFFEDEEISHDFDDDVSSDNSEKSKYVQIK